MKCLFQFNTNPSRPQLYIFCCMIVGLFLYSLRSELDSKQQPYPTNFRNRVLLQQSSVTSSFVLPFIIWISIVVVMFCCCKIRNAARAQQLQANQAADIQNRVVVSILNGQDPAIIVAQAYRIQGQHLAEQLDTFQFNEKMANPEHSACPICLDNYKDGEEIMILPCFHQFHRGCVQPWMEDKGDESACPVCKQNIKALLQQTQSTVFS